MHYCCLMRIANNIKQVVASAQNKILLFFFFLSIFFMSILKKPDEVAKQETEVLK